MSQVRELQQRENELNSQVSTLLAANRIAAQHEPLQQRQWQRDDSVHHVVLVMLHHTGLANKEVWSEWLQLLPVDVRVVFHVCQGAGVVGDPIPGYDIIKDRLLPVQYEAKWGKTSLLVATLKCMHLTLEHIYPNAQHIMLASGTHLPLSADPFAGVQPGESWVPRMLATSNSTKEFAVNGLMSLGYSHAEVGLIGGTADDVRQRDNHCSKHALHC